MKTSFIDQGFEDISLIGVNYLNTPRIIASRVNEDHFLTDLPGSKSFTQQLILVLKTLMYHLLLIWIDYQSLLLQTE